MVTPLLHRSEVIIRPTKHGNEQDPPNPLQQDTPFPCMPHDEMTMPPFSEPSQHDEPHIPGQSQCPKPQVLSHEDPLNCEPESEEAPMQSLEEPFGTPSTPTPVPSPEIPPIASENPTASSPPAPSSPLSHNEAWQELTNLCPNLMIPWAIVDKSINRIWLEHRQFLHMIHFMDATHQNEMHREFGEKLNSLLGQELEAYPKEEIIRIVSKLNKK
ncbi:hypothetical protein O181_010695 [Austropuccinia psidii MF-1]|uniref:Uncharacterized protein n=1 Tax=Austropuccinia psidii MF-1 TaxID=1389203 RepID=A0A9Q3GL61_9BASI|nr:hypothetical protein [Austropuccinia psidii MF-1]